MAAWEIPVGAGLGLFDYFAALDAERRNQDRLESGIGRLDAAKDELRGIFGMESRSPFGRHGDFTIDRSAGSGSRLAGGAASSGRGHSGFLDPIEGRGYPDLSPPGDEPFIRPDIDDLFTQAESFREGIPAGGFGSAADQLAQNLRRQLRSDRDAISGRLREAMIPVGSTFDVVDFPDFSGDAYRAAAMGDIAAGREAQTQVAREQAVARGLSQGRSLSEIAPDLDVLEYQLGGQAGQLARGVENTIETNRLGYGAQRAALQADLASKEQAINAALGQQDAQIMAALAGQEAGLGETLGRFGQTMDFNTAANLANLTGADQINTSNLELALRNMSQQDRQAFASLMSGLTTGQATGEFNYNQIVPQIFPAFVSLMNAREDNQPESKGSSGLSIFGFGFSSGCIVDTALVPTPDGAKPLESLKVGDVVIDGDDNEAVIVAKDHGDDPNRPRLVWFETDDGARIGGTPDHVVDGETLGERLAGDVIERNGKETRIVRLWYGPYQTMGDLALSSRAEWVANGFRVKSRIQDTIDTIGIDAWESKIDDYGHIKQEVA